MGDSDSESGSVYEYAETEFDDLQDVGDHVMSDINESEDNINAQNNLIQEFQNRMDNLYAELGEDQISFVEFQTDIKTTQQQIAMTRVEGIQEYLELEQLTKIRSEINDIFKKASKLDYPALDNTEQKRFKLSKYEESLRSQTEDVIEKYKVLNLNKKESEAPLRLDIYPNVTTGNIEWFIDELPKNKDDMDIVIGYFHNNIPNLSKKQAIQIFGSWNKATKIFNTLDKPDFKKLQKYITSLIAVVDTDFNKMDARLRELETSELMALKGSVSRTGKFNKTELKGDFQLMVDGVDKRVLKKFMDQTGIMDPDEAEEVLLKGIMTKYSRYLKTDGNTQMKNIFLKKPVSDIPVRSAPTLTKNMNFEDYSNLLEDQITAQNRINNAHSLGKLKGILAKFPKKTLITCINEARHNLTDSYVYRLYVNRSKITNKTKFVENTGEIIESEIVPKRKLVAISKRVKKQEITLNDFDVPVFNYFALNKRGLKQLYENSEIGERVKNKMVSWMNLMDSSEFGPSFQRVPMNYRPQNSIVFESGNKQIKVIPVLPPSDVAHLWSVDGKFTSDFTEYLVVLREKLREKLSVRLEPATLIVITKKVKAINRYLGERDGVVESIEIVEPDPVSNENTIRDKGVRWLKEKVLSNIPLGVSQNVALDSLDRLEQVVASCVKDVSVESYKYRSRLNELYYIIMLYPSVVAQMAQGVILPTDVINIKTEFTGTVSRESFDELVRWAPSTTNLDKHTKLKKIVKKESRKPVPTETVITYDDVKGLNIPLLIKKSIIRESYEYLKWVTALKRVEESLDNGVSRKTVTTFLNKEKMKLRGKAINTNQRVSSIKKIAAKIKNCERDGLIPNGVENTNKEILASRVEMVVHQLSTNNKEYQNAIGNVVSDTVMSAFCDLFTPNNLQLVEIVAKRYIIMPQIFKGKNDQETLANSSIPVLRALRGLQNNMADVMDNFSKVRGDIKKMGRQMALRSIMVKQMIKRKQEVDAKEAYSVFNGTVRASEIDKINNQENMKLAKTAFSILSTNDINRWRQGVYTPPAVSRFIPRNGVWKIVPLPNKSGFWVGGVFPDNVMAYRYTRDGMLYSHLQDLGTQLMNPNQIVYKSTNITQPPTTQEISILDSVRNSMRFKFRNNETDYSVQELENICMVSGYNTSPELSKMPWNVLDNGDRKILSLREYITKLIATDNAYTSPDKISVRDLNVLNKQYDLDLKPSDTKGVTGLENIITDYNKFLMLLDENMDPSVMYRRCILDNLEPVPVLSVAGFNKGKRELMLMGIREFRRFKIKESKERGYRRPTDQEISREYFEMKKSNLRIKDSNSGYYIVGTNIYKVKKDRSNNYPVPVEYSGQFPVYANRQLNDLGNLLLSGTLSPWLVNDIGVVYGNTPTSISVGSFVSISGKDSNEKVVNNKIGVVEKIQDDNYYVKYDLDHFSSFTKGSLKPLVRNDITGFTGDPPWFIKNLNIQAAMKYLKSPQFEELNGGEQKAQLMLMIREFGVFGDNLTADWVIKELLAQRSKLMKIEKTQNSLTSSERAKLYDQLKFINPVVLSDKIITRHKTLLDSWATIRSNEYRSMDGVDRYSHLGVIIADLDIDVEGLKLPVDADMGVMERRIIGLLDDNKRKIDETLVFLKDRYWLDERFNKRFKMYNEIADKMDIKSEVASKDAFEAKLGTRIMDIDNTLGYLKGELSRESESGKVDNLIRIVNDYGITIKIPNSQTVYSRLSKLNLNSSSVSNFYIEQKFDDHFGKEIIVRSGVSKNKVIWRGVKWDPCNYFTNSEKDKRLRHVIGYLKSREFADISNKRQIFQTIHSEWGGVAMTTESVISELEALMVGGLEGGCFGNGFDCIWDTGSKVCSSNVKPVDAVETPEQRIERLLTTTKSIESLPKLDTTEREYKQYKKDDKDVWAWQPYPRPRNNNTKAYKKWASNPDVKLWNNKIKKALRELESLLFRRVRSGSKTFLKKKAELTADLESFRMNMKSQKVPVDKVIRRAAPSTEMFDYDQTLATKNIVKSYLKKFLDAGIIRVTNGAMDMLKSESILSRDYFRFKVTKVDRGVRVLNGEKYHDVKYSEVRTQGVDILDVLMNMSYTRRLDIQWGDEAIKAHGYGVLLDYIIKMSDVYGYGKLKGPDEPVVITVRDILDYMGDSYTQFGTYTLGIGYDEIDGDIKYSFLRPPCGYTDIIDKDNSYLTFDGPELQGVYTIAEDLHKPNAISSNTARRAALILGLDLRYIPPCFGLKPSKWDTRTKQNAITGEDVKTYFARSGKGFYLEEMDLEDLKSSGNETLLYKQKKDQEDAKKVFTKALKNIFNGGVKGKDLESKVKTASRLFKIDAGTLGGIAELMDATNSMGQKDILDRLVIPVLGGSITDSTLRSRMDDISAEFRKNYGFSLKEYLSDPRLTKGDRPINISRWTRVD